jgi:shikimate dehydrogenase
MGLNWVYLPLRVSPQKLQAAIAGLKTLDFAGVNVTVPHKLGALELCDRLEGEAIGARSVNTLILEQATGEVIGHSTDGAGWLRSLGELPAVPKGDLFLIGAGGAARAVAYALVNAGLTNRVHIFNRTRERAEELAALLRAVDSTTETYIADFTPAGAKALAGAQIILNTTPLAREDAGELPLDYGLFHPDQVVCDLDYVRSRTAFLEEAERRGCSVLNGRGMLVHQAAASLELWTGLEAPVDSMRAAMDAYLEGAGKERVG